MTNDHPVDHGLIDGYFLEVEKSLGYEDTPIKLFIEIKPYEIDGDDGYFPCLFGKCDGLFYLPRIYDGIHYKIEIHLGEDDGSLCYTALAFELNRYFKHIHCSPDWDCEDNICLADYIAPFDLASG